MTGAMDTIELPDTIRTVLDTLEGQTPAQKIAALLRSELRRTLLDCEAELLEFEIKYGMDYPEFQRKLNAGHLGDVFGYELEMDAMRWDDLHVEKKHYLQQMADLKVYYDGYSDF